MEEYTQPEMEIIMLNGEDVIASSNPITPPELPEVPVG